MGYSGYYSSYTGRKIPSIINKYRKDLNVKIILSPFKHSAIFSLKYFVPDSLKSRVVYQVTCAGCGVILVKQMGILTRVLMSISFGTKIPTLTFKHLGASKGFKDKCDISCFKIIDHASTYS